MALKSAKFNESGILNKKAKVFAPKNLPTDASTTSKQYIKFSCKVVCIRVFHKYMCKNFFYESDA